MRTEKEIIKKRKKCFTISLAMHHYTNGEAEADYFSGAWHALMWVLEEEKDI